MQTFIVKIDTDEKRSAKDLSVDDVLDAVEIGLVRLGYVLKDVIVQEGDFSSCLNQNRRTVR